jgi:hypothetical protein
MRTITVCLLLIAVLLSSAAPVQAAYEPRYTRLQAYKYASDGVHERYVFGGSKFRNNNRWDSDEGIDCSGYAAKVWAVKTYHSPMYAYHPYSTKSFYDGIGYGRFKDRRYPYFMRIWVYRKSAGGPGNHMGLFDKRNADGTWMTFEARGAAYGVVYIRRSLSTLISWKYKLVERKDWG